MRWIAIALLALCVPAGAQNATLTQRQVSAFSNLQMEYSVCIAYFNIIKGCAPVGKEADAEASFGPTIKMMTDMAFRIGSNVGMTQDAMLARLKMAYEEQGKIMNNNCINAASLYTRYAARCKQLGENADSIFEEYMKK